MQRKLRKSLSDLRIAGAGVIAFGAWTIVRLIIYSTIGTSVMNEIMEEARINGDGLSTTMVYAVLVIILGADFGWRLFVGFSARAEGKGAKKSIVYVIFAIMLGAYYIITVPYDIINFSYNPQSFLDTALSIFIDFTSMLITLWLIVTAIRVKVLKKRIAAGGGD